jgi:hypothetical protein
LESRNSRDRNYHIGAMANGAGEKKTVTVDVERFVHTRNAVSFTQITTNLRHQHLTPPPPPPQFAHDETHCRRRLHNNCNIAFRTETTPDMHRDAQPAIASFAPKT